MIWSWIFATRFMRNRSDTEELSLGNSKLETRNCSYGLASTMFNVHAPWAGVKVQKGFR